MGIKSTSDIFFIFSVAAAMMAVLSWALKPDTLWLAATQWLVIASAVGIWAIYLRIRDIHEGKATMTVKNGNGKVAKKNKSQGALEIPSLIRHESKLSHGLARNYKQLVVVCHNIRSAYNVGSIFRTADGAGVAKVYLTGYTPAPPHAGISKTALGAEKFVNWEKIAKIGTVFEKLKKEKYELAAVEQNTKSTSYDFFRPKGRVALILGNEVRGLSLAVLRRCDKIIEIPMRGEKESLNVSVAFGIAVYSTISRQ